MPDPQPTNLRHSDSECRIVFLGTLSERKGVPELIHALGGPALRGRRWRATLAGDGRVEEFRRLASELGIADRIEFLGWVDQAVTRTVCEAADVLVLPSHAEGLAMSILEGLSHGLAVIATPVGAHNEVIEPEVSGLFVPPGNVEALSVALARVIDDPSLRARLGAAGAPPFSRKLSTYAAMPSNSGKSTLLSCDGDFLALAARSQDRHLSSFLPSSARERSFNVIIARQADSDKSSL